MEAKKQKRGSELDPSKSKGTNAKPAGVPGIASFFTKKQPLSTPATSASSSESAATSKETSPSSIENVGNEKAERKELLADNADSVPSQVTEKPIAKAQAPKVPVHPLFLGAAARKAAVQSAHDGTATAAGVAAKQPTSSEVQLKQQDSSTTTASAVTPVEPATRATASTLKGETNPEVVEIVDISSDDGDGDVIFIDSSASTAADNNKSKGKDRETKSRSAGVSNDVTSTSAGLGAATADEKEVIEVTSGKSAAASAASATASGKSGLFFLSKVSQCTLSESPLLLQFRLFSGS
jgi:hypothetical protein